MLSHFLYFVILGAILAIVFTFTDKLTAKIEDAKKRKYIKIAIYAILMFIGACIDGIIIHGWE